MKILSRFYSLPSSTGHSAGPQLPFVKHSSQGRGSADRHRFASTRCYSGSHPKITPQNNSYSARADPLFLYYPLPASYLQGNKTSLSPFRTSAPLLGRCFFLGPLPCKVRLRSMPTAQTPLIQPFYLPLCRSAQAPRHHLGPIAPSRYPHLNHQKTDRRRWKPHFLNALSSTSRCHKKRLLRPHG